MVCPSTSGHAERGPSGAGLCVHCGTDLGTDCGAEGTGMWYSLAGLMAEKDECLDFTRCFPLVRVEYQPSCVGATIRAKGAGSVRLELKSAEGRVLWWGTGELALRKECRSWLHLGADSLRKVKSLHWTAEAGAQIPWTRSDLNIRMPELPFEEEVFLLPTPSWRGCTRPNAAW